MRDNWLKRLTRDGLRVQPMGAWSLAAALLIVPGSAAASLGGDAPSVHGDAAQLKGDERVEPGDGYFVSEIRLPSGTRVREYISVAGNVFAVTWRGPFRPDLRRLLGRYFDAFQQAAQAAKRLHRGGGPLVLSTSELVVHMAGTGRSFFGRAYVPDLVPANVSPRDLP
ncbi:MAG: DUF2844 domain-containing protein [Polyangiaceae bacterium]